MALRSIEVFVAYGAASGRLMVETLGLSGSGGGAATSTREIDHERKLKDTTPRDSAPEGNALRRTLQDLATQSGLRKPTNYL